MKVYKEVYRVTGANASNLTLRKVLKSYSFEPGPDLVWDWSAAPVC
jgi:hypothetical protein